MTGELIDTKELIGAMERFFNNREYHTKRIKKLIQQWEEEDGEY